MRVNNRIRDIAASTTLAITARAKELKAHGHDIVNFAAGEPDFDTPDYIKQAAVKALEDGFTKYTPSIGTLDLRAAIARKFKKDNNLDYKPSQIAVSCGAKHSLFNVIHVLADTGDEVIIPAPYWVSYPQMVKLAGADSCIVKTLPQNNFKMTIEQLLKSISLKSRILILCSPSNPTGVVYNTEELRKIAEVCVQHKIYVISDEIYEKLVYDTAQYTSIASFGKDIHDLTVTVNGVSKAYAMTGWRIGYCAGPQEIIDYVNKFQDHSTSNPCSISQMAALKALESCEETISAMRQEFKIRRDLMISLLDKIPQLKYIRPEGAFYVLCDFSKLGDSQLTAKRILDDIKVAVIPADDFGCPGYIRLSFATSREKITEGINRIGQWVSAQGR